MNNTEMNGVKSFLRMIAEKNGLQFVVGGHAAATNGKTVYLPALENCEMGEMCGYAFHEALHIVHTDMQLMINGSVDFQTRNPALCKSLANAVEDTRIEMLGCQEYPGGQVILNKRITALINSKRYCQIRKDANAASNLATYVCLYGKVNFLQSPPALTAILAEERAKLVEQIGEEIVKTVDETLFQSIPRLKRFEGAITLACRLYDMLREKALEQNPSGSEEENGSEESGSSSNCAGSQSGMSSGMSSDSNAESSEGKDSNSSSEGQSGNSSGSSFMTADGPDSDGSSGEESDSQSGNAENAQGSASSQNESSSSSGETDEAASQARKSALASILTAAQAVNHFRNAVTDGKRVLSTDDRNDESFTPSFEESVWSCTDPKTYASLYENGSYAKETMERGQRLVKEAMASANAVRTCLNGLLETQKRTGVYYAREGRKLGSSVMGRLAVGNLRVMEKRESPRKGMDSVVSVLLDTSGSMAGTEHIVSVQAALTLLMAVRRIKGCSSALSVFPDNRFCTAETMTGAAEIVAPGSSTLKMSEIQRIGSMEAYGGSYIEAGLNTTLSRLEDCPQPRKVLIVVTDGYCDCNPAFTERLKKDKVDLYILGIGTLGNSELTKIAAHVVELNPAELMPEQLAAKVKEAVLAFTRHGMLRAR